MPKTENNKLRTLKILEFLYINSDSEHRFSIAEINEYLAQFGLEAERKAIYNDFAVLREFGIEINAIKDKHYKYYIDGREFEIAELKLLVDAVASSRFISQAKSRKLIAKISKLASVHEAENLKRSIKVVNRGKSSNERVYYNVDILHRAIAENKMVSFKYFDYNISGKKTFRKNGERYVVSPYMLNWDNENYYLLCHYERHGDKITPFRVDRMELIEIEEIRAKKALPEYNLSQYSNQVFGMYFGESKPLKLRFSNELLNPVIDKFGRQISAYPNDENTFNVVLNINVSPNFYGWLMQFGNRACIVSPDSEREKFKEYVKSVYDLYDIKNQGE